jgi:hypothetical protein
MLSVRAVYVLSSLQTLFGAKIRTAFLNVLFLFRLGGIEWHFRALRVARDVIAFGKLFEIIGGDLSRPASGHLCRCSPFSVFDCFRKLSSIVTFQRTAQQGHDTPDAHHRVENHRWPQPHAVQSKAEAGESQDSDGGDIIKQHRGD